MHEDEADGADQQHRPQVPAMAGRQQIDEIATGETRFVAPEEASEKQPALDRAAAGRSQSAQRGVSDWRHFCGPHRLVPGLPDRPA